MALLALLLAGAAYAVLRKRGHHLLAWLAAVALAAGGVVADMHEARAFIVPTYTVVLTPGGSPASVTVSGADPIFSGIPIPVDVQNTAATPVTVTSIAVSPWLVLDAASPINAGSVIPAGSTVVGGVLVTGVCPHGTLPDGLGGCS